jgi:hypothetical protein
MRCATPMAPRIASGRTHLCVPFGVLRGKTEDIAATKAAFDRRSDRKKRGKFHARIDWQLGSSSGRLGSRLRTSFRSNTSDSLTKASYSATLSAWFAICSGISQDVHRYPLSCIEQLPPIGGIQAQAGSAITPEQRREWLRRGRPACRSRRSSFSLPRPS